MKRPGNHTKTLCGVLGNSPVACVKLSPSNWAGITFISTTGHLCPDGGNCNANIIGIKE